MEPLRAENLIYETGGKHLLGPVNIELDDPGVTMVLGFNGAGKSILLRLLHGMISPSDGKVAWGGRPMSKEIRQRQAMVFQKPVLLRRSAAANVDFALRLRDGTSLPSREELLDRVGLLAMANRPARSLSGGEQQRLALARAMATAPEILFLDEPTANLDPASVLLIEQIVAELNANGTKVIFVSHDIAQAKRMAHDVLFLHKGLLMEHAPAKTFFSRPASEAAQAYLKGELLG
ncbi:MAG: ATP-binding cassette domain-containing protein [Pseudomonadota bacterium]